MGNLMKLPGSKDRVPRARRKQSSGEAADRAAKKKEAESAASAAAKARLVAEMGAGNGAAASTSNSGDVAADCAVGEIEGATTTAGGANQLDDDAAGNTSPAPELIEEQGNQARVRDLQQYGIFNRRAYGISRQ